jgi:hypothetical protein
MKGINIVRIGLKIEIETLRKVSGKRKKCAQMETAWSTVTE